MAVTSKFLVPGGIEWLVYGGQLEPSLGSTRPQGFGNRSGEIRLMDVVCRAAYARFSLCRAICGTKQRARLRGGFIISRRRFLPAPARRCQAGKAEAEQDERTGLRYA